MATELRTTLDTRTGGPALRRSSVRLITVFFMIYILVSGGSFGIEDMVSSSGPGLTILLLVLLPVFWSLPMALVASELGSALPGEGGFYIWARRGLGDFWGFQTAWWWSLSIFVDSSVYIVLGVGYLQNWLHFSQLWFYVICWAIIAAFTLVNIYGVQLVALSSSLFSVLIIAPFVALIVVGLAKWQFNPLTPFTAPGVPFIGTGQRRARPGPGHRRVDVLRLRIHVHAVGRDPQPAAHHPPGAACWPCPSSSSCTCMPTVAGLAAYGHWGNWATQAGGGYVSFVEIGRKLGGSALGVRAAGLGAARQPGPLPRLPGLGGAAAVRAVARTACSPSRISGVSKRWGTPVAAIVLMAALNAVLIIGPFRNLVVIDVILFISSYVVIFVAAVRLRVRGAGPQAPVPRAVRHGRHGRHGRPAHPHRASSPSTSTPSTAARPSSASPASSCWASTWAGTASAASSRWPRARCATSCSGDSSAGPPRRPSRPATRNCWRPRLDAADDEAAGLSLPTEA